MPPEPPYGVIWNRMKSGKVIPFLGAGASLSGRDPAANWDPGNPRFLPSGRELSRLLAAESSFPSETQGDLDDLAKVSSYYSIVSGRSVLRERLREVLNHPYGAGELHSFLASVPAHQVIVTTNYDSLLEQAFITAGRPFDLVIYPADRKDIANAVLWWPHGKTEPVVAAPNELSIDLAKTTVIFKMHGTLKADTDKWDNFVITEEDYVEFLSRMTANTAIPAIFYDHFRERSFLFLGYGLSDWNLRVILKNLSKCFASGHPKDPEEEALPSWAVQFHPSDPGPSVVGKAQCQHFRPHSGCIHKGNEPGARRVACRCRNRSAPMSDSSPTRKRKGNSSSAANGTRGSSFRIFTPRP